MPKKLQAGEETKKVEVRMPATLKAQAEQAARIEGDGDISSWVRGLVRAAVKRLGLDVVVEGKAKRKER